MPASRSVRALGALVVAAVVAALGVACAPQPTDAEDGRSVSAACAALADAVEEAMTAFADADAADAASAAKTTAAVRDELTRVAATLDNARVEAIAAGLAAGFDTLAEATASSAAGDITGVAGLADATDRIRTGVAEYHDLCSG